MLRWKLTGSSESFHDESLHYKEPAASDSDETRFSPNPIKEPEEERVLSDTDDENLLAGAYHVKPGFGQDGAGVMQTQCTEEMLRWSETQLQDPVDPHQGALAQEMSAWSETQLQDPVDPHQGALAQEMSAWSETQLQDPVDPHQGALAQEMSAWSETQLQDPVDPHQGALAQEMSAWSETQLQDPGDPHQGALAQEMSAWSETQLQDPADPHQGALAQEMSVGSEPHLGALAQQTQCTEEMLAWSETQGAVAKQALECTEEMLAWSETQFNATQPQDLPLPDHGLNVGLTSKNLILDQAEEKEVHIQIGGPQEWNTQVYEIHMDDVKRLLFSEPATTYPDTMDATSNQHVETKIEAKTEVNSWDFLTKTGPEVKDLGGGESPMWICSQTDMRVDLDLDSIISTLQEINFLGPHEAHAILSGLGVPEDEVAGCAEGAGIGTATSSLQGWTSAAPAPSWTRGRGRGKMLRTPKPRSRPRKRSRSSSNRPGRTRAPAPAALATPESSPEQEAPRKSRKVCENKVVNDQPNFRRLQELRFLMQDVLAGSKEPPTAFEAEAMREEVLDILRALAALEEGRVEHSKADKSRLEQATQAAEKLLRQFQILLLDANSCESFPYQAEEIPRAQLQHDTDVTEARPNKQPLPKRRKSTTKRPTPRRSRRQPASVTPARASTCTASDSTITHHQKVSQDEPKQPGPLATATPDQTSSCTATDLRNQYLHQTLGCSEMQRHPDPKATAPPDHQAEGCGRQSATPNLESSGTVTDSTFMCDQNLHQAKGCPQPGPGSTRKSPEPGLKNTMSSGRHAEPNSDSGKNLNQISVPYYHKTSEMSEDLLNPGRNETSSSVMSESLLDPGRHKHIQEKHEGLFKGKEQTSKPNFENVLFQERIADLDTQFEHPQCENTLLSYEFCGSNDAGHNVLAPTEKINTFRVPPVPMSETFHKKQESDSSGNALTPKYTKGSLLKISSKAEKDEYIWRGGPLALNMILLPKKSEFFSINDLPSDFWDDPNANIPEGWISGLEWED